MIKLAKLNNRRNNLAGFTLHLFKKSEGFTLIELLMVISIVSLLSSITLVATKNAAEKARIAKGLQFSASIKNSIGDDLRGEWTCETGYEFEPGNWWYDPAIDTSGNNNVCELYANTEGPWCDDGSASADLGKSIHLYIYDMIHCNPSASLNITGKEITIEAWINPTYTENRPIVNKGWYSTENDYNEYQYGLIIMGNKIKLILNGNDTLGDSGDGGVISANHWYHVAASYNQNSSQIRYYINGVQTNTASYSQEIVPGSITYPGGLLIGFTATGWTDYRGRMDNVRVYGRALTGAKIQQHYAEGAAKHGLTVDK